MATLLRIGSALLAAQVLVSILLGILNGVWLSALLNVAPTIGFSILLLGLAALLETVERMRQGLEAAVDDLRTPRE